MGLRELGLHLGHGRGGELAELALLPQLLQVADRLRIGLRHPLRDIDPELRLVGVAGQAVEGAALLVRVSHVAQIRGSRGQGPADPAVREHHPVAEVVHCAARVALGGQVAVLLRSDRVAGEALSAVGFRSAGRGAAALIWGAWTVPPWLSGRPPSLCGSTIGLLVGFCSARQGVVERGCSCWAAAGRATSRAQRAVAARCAFIVRSPAFGMGGQ